MHISNSDTYNKFTDSAIAYVRAGLSVIPVDQKKQPVIRWKQYQSAIPDLFDLARWWRGNNANTSMMAIVCGKVSGNLECLDFDEKYNAGNTSIFSQWEALVEQRQPGLIGKLPRQRTMNNGYHVFYRCSVIEGNKKLTRRLATPAEVQYEPSAPAKTLIETRGEGGYILCAPSNGYSLLHGSLCSIPEITPKEREILFTCAYALSEDIEESLVIRDSEIKSKKNRPGDSFNREGNHKSLLESHGWVCVEDKADKEFWRRPGKNEGISASYLKNKGYFYVFTSNAPGLEPNKAYDKFALYASLETNGNFAQASSQLAGKGFGVIHKRGNNNEALAKLEQFLDERYEFRYNVVTCQLEFRKLDATAFVPMSDYELNSIEWEIRKENILLGIEAITRLLYSRYTKEFNPFISYFESLPKWDRSTDYIQDLCASVEFFTTKDMVDFYCCLWRWLTGVAGCAVDDPTINQTSIILVGKQGIGKSRWLNALIPPSLDKYKFIGTINPENKDTQIYLSECLIINLDELETLKRADIGSLKSIMTLPMVKVRRPFERLSKDYPRRASFVGSINQSDFLNDPTGARRFLTFEVKKFHFDKMPDINMVMSQAYTLYKEGEKWWFSDAEMAIINNRNKQFTETGYEEELLLQYTSPDTELFDGVWRSATEVAGQIRLKDDSVKVDARFVRNLGYALVKHEYKTKRFSGLKKYAVKFI